MDTQQIETYVRPVLDSLATDESEASKMWKAWAALQLSQLLDELPGPQLLTAEQIDAMDVGSIIETYAEGYSIIYIRKEGYWAGSNGAHAYKGNSFVIGKTYLVRNGPLK